MYVCVCIHVRYLRKIFSVCLLILLRSAEKYSKNCCLFAKIYYVASCKALVSSHYRHSHLTSLCIAMFFH
jgi:hypothetical protein